MRGAYGVLVSTASGKEAELSRDQAHDLLLDHDAFTSEPADADYAIERLLDSSWPYGVDGSPRITYLDR